MSQQQPLPDYLNPKELIKSPDLVRTKERIEEEKQFQNSGFRHASRREMEIDRMFGSIQRNVVKDTVMSMREFAKYEILYSHDLQQKIINNEVDEETLVSLENLSKEFQNRVNLFRPIHLVDDSGNEVCVLPPIQNRLEHLHSGGDEAINIFHNANIRDENTPMGALQQQKATANLHRIIALSQNQETILENIGTFDELAQQFHLQVFGKPVFQEAETSQTPSAQQGSSDSPDMFDFEPPTE